MEYSASGSPVIGLRYRLMDYPVVEVPYPCKPYPCKDEPHRSWVYSHVTNDTPVIVGKPAGFLFTNVVSS